MSRRFNLLTNQSEENNLIRVSRVDAKKGIVSGLTVEEANLYSFTNPGETYIFIDGDNNVHYLGINKVNKLKNKNLKRTRKCDTSVKECGPPTIKIFGGGGLGAVGNPVISTSGAILAVDVIHGGHGYETVPKAIVNDACELGGGATLQVVLGEQPFFEEYFDDTEEIVTPEPDPNTVLEGNVPNFDENGKELGTEFNPRKYFAGSEAIEAEAASAGELFDPIQEQIAAYEKLVRSLKNPFWTTRKGQPGKLTMNGEPLTQVYPVIMPPRSREAFERSGQTPWDAFLDKYGVSPTPPSDIPGSDFAGRLFAHEYLVDFPIDGDYVFRGLCDNEGLVYLDSEKILDVSGFGKIKTLKKSVKKGLHRLRLDLLNKPNFETISASTSGPQVPIVYNDLRTGAGGSGEKSYDIEYVDLNKSNKSIRVRNNGKRIELKDGHKSDTNVEFEIKSTSPGVSAKFSDDGKKLEVKGAGDVTLRLKYDDNPNFGGEAVRAIKIAGKTWKKERKHKGSDIHTIKVYAKPRQAPSPFKVMEGKKRIILDDNPGNGFDINGTLTIESSNVGATFADDGRSILYNGSAGEIEVKYKWDDDPKNSGKVVSSIDVNGVRFNQNGEKGSITKVINVKEVARPGLNGFSIKEVDVFDTIKYIDKADRTLYRSDPAGNGLPGNRSAPFISQYGISPFSFLTNEAQTNSYAGTHVIRWEFIDFPVDGEYEVTIDCDDNVKLFIGNREGAGAKEIGNGLRDVRQGGDETIINYAGFRSPGTPNPPLTQSISLKKGKYRLRAELTQIDVGPLAKGNPMALAIQIKSKTVEKTVISAQSWNQNPMAIALAIEAPPPGGPPTENIVKRGRCKDNPIWSTRHPGGSQQWYPVEIAKNKGGNPYLNRYTVSPVPPLDTPNSDGSGVVWRNDWTVDIPYPGKYRIDGARADTARILINDKVVTGLTGPYGGPALDWVQKNFAGWNDPKTNNSRVGRKSTFVDLEEGKYKVSVELVNVPQVQQTLINEEVFGAEHWIGEIQRPSETSRVPIVYNDLRTGTVGKDEETYRISYTDLNPSNIPSTGRGARRDGIRVTKNGTQIELKDGRGNDVNVTFRIVSTSPGVSAKFADDGKELKVKGVGDVTLKLEYDDNPNYAGEAVRAITIAGTKWRKERKHKGSDTHTIKVHAKKRQAPSPFKVLGGRKKIILDDNPGNGFDINGTLTIESSDNGARFAEDGRSIEFNGPGKVTVKYKWDDDPGNSGKVVSSIDVNGVRFPQKGEKGSITKVIDVSINRQFNVTRQTAYTREGVKYDGPELFKFSHPRWSSYFNKFSVCPFFPDLNSENPDIAGEFVYTWSNVKFPESTQYDISFAADNVSELFIDGKLVLNGRGFDMEDPSWRKVNITEGIHTIQVKVVNLPSSRNVFRDNPTGLLLRIRVPRLIDGDGASWKDNPIGISAAMVAPPCPKPSGGVGIVTAIIPIDPGNGYVPVAGNNVYNVGLELQEIIPVDPGRAYELGPIELEGPAEAEISEIGPNGEILKVSVTPGLGYTDIPAIVAPNGYNAVLVPVFKVIRDPLIEPDRLVQVTDLAGLKQTGYVLGRPYYGAVFLKDGIRYAGYYETAGELVQVYDTLQESIDSQVTTAPSAIQRQGTDITSNDPRLNIPNTPSDGVNFN